MSLAKCLESNGLMNAEDADALGKKALALAEEKGIHIAQAEAVIKNEFINAEYSRLQTEMRGLKDSVYGKQKITPVIKFPLPDFEPINKKHNDAIAKSSEQNIDQKGLSMSEKLALAKENLPVADSSKSEAIKEADKNAKKLLAKLLGPKKEKTADGPPIRKIGNADISNGDLKDDKNVAEYAAKAKAVLEGLYPNAKLEAYDTEKEYEAAGGQSGSRGFAIMGKEGQHRILLNLQQIKEDNSGKTAFHEVIHPIVYDAFGTDAEALVPLWNELAVAMENVPGMEAVFNHVQWYGGKTIAVEGITELLTQIASGNIDLKDVPKAKVNKIFELINKLFDALGIKFHIDSPESFTDIANKIKSAFETGNVEDLRNVIKGKKIDEYLKQFDKSEKGVTSQNKSTDNESGTTLLKRLRPAEEQGRINSGEINVLASTFLSRLHQATRQKFGNNSRELATIKASEETYLEDFAKQTEVWKDKAEEGIGNFFDNGQENKVYLNPSDTSYLTKLNNLNLNENWLDLLDRIALHNTYFPSTSYTLQGFGRDADGNFVAIMKQNFVIGAPLSQQEIVDYMSGRGYELLSKYDEDLIGTEGEFQNFIDKKNGIVVEDLHLNNVRKDSNGNIFVIDPVISLDTENRGYGGNRNPNTGGSTLNNADLSDMLRKARASAQNVSLKEIDQELKDYGDEFIAYVQKTNPKATAQEVIKEVAKEKGKTDPLTFTESEAIGLYDYIVKQLPEPAPEPAAVKDPPKKEKVTESDYKVITDLLNAPIDSRQFPNHFDMNQRLTQVAAKTQSEGQDNRDILDGTYVKVHLEDLQAISIEQARILKDSLGKSWKAKTIQFFEENPNAGNTAQVAGIFNVMSKGLFDEINAARSGNKISELRDLQNRLDRLALNNARTAALTLNQRRLYDGFGQGKSVEQLLSEVILSDEQRYVKQGVEEALKKKYSDEELNQPKQPKPKTPKSANPTTAAPKKTKSDSVKKDLISKGKTVAQQKDENGNPIVASFKDKLNQAKDAINGFEC